jgi:hypothetical protein
MVGSGVDAMDIESGERGGCFECPTISDPGAEACEAVDNR